MHVSKWDTCCYSNLRVELLTMLFQVLKDFFHRLTNPSWLRWTNEFLCGGMIANPAIPKRSCPLTPDYFCQALRYVSAAKQTSTASTEVLHVTVRLLGWGRFLVHCQLNSVLLTPEHDIFSLAWGIYAERPRYI